MVNLMPKLYTYYLVIGETTTELTTDPKGWQEHSVAFSRSDDFGNNIEHTIPLLFSKEARTLLKAEYESKGLFSNVNCIIKKRNDDWTISTFYEYKLDFNTYNDTIDFIEITGIEIGLLSKVMAYRDTEYDIALPTTGKTFMSYTGVTINKKNLIQCGYGETIELSHVDWYSPQGYRSVSTYNDKISFVDANGLPWKHMMFQALVADTFKIRVKLNLKIRIQYPFGGFTAPASKPMWLLKHNAAMTSVVAGDILHEFTPTASDANNFLSRRTDGFIGYDVTGDYAITLDKPYVSLVYPQDNGTYLKAAEVMEGFDTFIEVLNDVASQYESATIEYVTHEWLIKQLLNKIYPSNTLTYSIPHTNFLPGLISDDCIRNLGKTDGIGKFTVKLSDVLKSIDILECIGIDITGSVMTIAPRANMYVGTKYKTVTANKISLKADISHVYNKISVGWDTKKREKDTDLVYPFNCKKTFEIPNSTVETELDLIHPFIGDCYEIEKHFDDIFTDETNSDKSDVCVIALKNDSNVISDGFTYISAAFSSGVLNNTDSVRITSIENLSFPDRITVSLDNIGDSVESVNTGIFKFTAPYTGIFTIDLNFIVKMNIEQEIRTSLYLEPNLEAAILAGKLTVYYEQINTTSVLPSTIHTILIYRMTGKLNLNKNDTYVFFPTIECIDDIPNGISVDSFELMVNKDSLVYYNLYKSHTITNFTGISSTVFNVPISPKRILNKHLPYVSISANGSTDDITFVSTELDSAITSQCDFELAEVVENDDVAPVTPLFLPSILSFETQEQLSSLTTVQSNKYKYIEVEHEKTGKIYSGWINNITFAVGKNKSQQWELQSRNI